MMKPEVASADVLVRKSTVDARDEIVGIPSQDIARLIALRHQDPHSILGIHPAARGIVIRDYRPKVEQYSCLLTTANVVR
jgi:hypothetical protein